MLLHNTIALLINMIEGRIIDIMVEVNIITSKVDASDAELMRAKYLLQLAQLYTYDVEFYTLKLQHYL